MTSEARMAAEQDGNGDAQSGRMRRAAIIGPEICFERGIVSLCERPMHDDHDASRLVQPCE